MRRIRFFDFCRHLPGAASRLRRKLVHNLNEADRS